MCREFTRLFNMLTSMWILKILSVFGKQNEFDVVIQLKYLCIHFQKINYTNCKGRISGRLSNISTKEKV